MVVIFTGFISSGIYLPTASKLRELGALDVELEFFY